MVFKGKAGYSLLIAIIAVNVFAVLLMKARTMWETELARDLEEELIFRARQYVTAIEFYKQKHSNLFPQDFDILFTENFLRKQYPDPMTEEGEWQIVMQSTTAGKKSLLIVPPDQLDAYLSKAQIVGVATASCEEGFREYRKKKRYCEWAFYVGEDPSKEMPDITFVGEEGDGGKEGGRDSDRGGSGGDRGRGELTERGGFGDESRPGRGGFND